MRNIIGVLFIVGGFIMGTFGDYPFDALPFQNLPLMAIGGLLIGLGIGVFVLFGDKVEEPPADGPPQMKL